MPDRQDLIDRIEAVFERAGADSDEHRRIVRLSAGMFAPIVTFPALPKDVQQRRLRSYSTDISQEATVDELRRVSLTARDFREALSGLHRPGIYAQHARGIDPHWRSDERMIELRRIEDAASAAAQDIEAMSEWPYERQRPRSQGSSRTVAGVVVNTYEEIFGGKADLPARAGGCPGLEKICAEIFVILGIKAHPKAAIRAALQQREEHQRLQHKSAAS
jgi:hypothetical protein